MWNLPVEVISGIAGSLIAVGAAFFLDVWMARNHERREGKKKDLLVEKFVIEEIRHNNSVFHIDSLVNKASRNRDGNIQLGYDNELVRTREFDRLREHIALSDRKGYDLIVDYYQLVMKVKETRDFRYIDRKVTMKLIKLSKEVLEHFED